MNQAIIQQKLVETLRQQAPLASLSAGDVAAKPQSMTIAFLDPPRLIQPQTLNLSVAGTT